MSKIYIDGRWHEVAEGKNLLDACLSLGLNLPYFCWHPALGSVGACRQCAVKLFQNETEEKEQRGKLIMSCMTPVSDGMRLSIADPEAKSFRASIIEWLMVNHPHDCPVCDEGGECHLQDMTLMTGHIYRRFRFKKRSFRNQDLGPFVNHEMNRCIACYRCVRFYRDYAGGRDLNVFSAHDQVYFGRHAEGRLENEFSGNLVEICPTGVFTDKTFQKHYTRKWDLQTAPSICPHCSLGCNTTPGERYGSLRRIRNRYHPEVNGYFICDRGRFGYEFVNSDRRLRRSWFREERKDSLAAVSGGYAVQRLGAVLSSPGAAKRTIGIGSPRASLEANFALRACVGPENFYSGFSAKDGEWVARAIGILEGGPVRSASIAEIERSDVAMVLGEDLTQTAPRVALALRQGTRVFQGMPYPTQLDGIATRLFHLPPDDLARLGFAVAHALEKRFPAVPNLSPELSAACQEMAQGLAQATRPVILSGAGIRSRAILEATANLAWALHRHNPETRISLTPLEPNSFGLGLLEGRPLFQAFQAMENGEVDTVVILENDLFRRAFSKTVQSFLAKAQRVVVMDHTATAMFPRADTILPAATPAESDGTFVNHEGRAQRFYQVFVPKSREAGPQIQASWHWLRDLMVAAGMREAEAWRTWDDLCGAMAEAFPRFRKKVEGASQVDLPHDEKIPRQEPKFFRRVPQAFFRHPKQWLAIPIHHLFGSEELSVLAPGISTLVPRPYVALGTVDAGRLSIQAGDVLSVNIEVEGEPHPRVPLLLSARLMEGIPSGIVCIPQGIRGLEGLDIELPVECQIAKKRVSGGVL